MEKKFINLRKDEALLQRAYDYLLSWGIRRRDLLAYYKYEPEDFAQDVLLQILTRKGFEELNADFLDARFESFLDKIARRKLVDVKRASHNKKKKTFVPTLSLNERVTNNEGDEIEFIEYVESPHNGAFEALLFDVVHSLSDQSVSPNFDLSLRDLFFKLQEKDIKELAEEFDVTTVRIYQLRKKLKNQVEEILYAS